MNIDLEIPGKIGFLLDPSRYKVIYGGRGSGKSWSVARALLTLGVMNRERILCVREVQKTIKESVHRLLSDQIVALGLQAKYMVLDTEIRGTNGTLFSFTGLSNTTQDNLKSFEGYNRCWVEEGQTTSDGSWNILIPTIRANDSEIWVTFNPVLDTDPTYKKLVANTPPDTKLAFLNYYDNPWFPSVLEQERLHCKATEPEDIYNNIWEGHCRAAVEGAIYATDVAKAQVDGRVCNLPYDPAHQVHTIWDLGFADNMAIIMAQKSRSEIRIIDYIEVNGRTTDHCVCDVKSRPYKWGFDFLPHDGFSMERKSGTSDEKILISHGRKVKKIPKTSEEDRIKTARSIFHQVAFDRTKAEQLLECLRRYRRNTNARGVDSSPVHDINSHGADAFGYMSQVVNEMVDSYRERPVRIPGYQTSGDGMGMLGN